MWPNTIEFCRVGKFISFQKSEFKVKLHTNMLKISPSEERRMARPAKDHATPAGSQASKVSKTARQRSYGLSITWTCLQYVLYGYVLWDWQICVRCGEWKVHSQVAKAMKGICFKGWSSPILFQCRSECKIPPGLHAASLCFPCLFSRTGQEWSANSNCCAWLLPWSVVSIVQDLAHTQSCFVCLCHKGSCWFREFWLCSSFGRNLQLDLLAAETTSLSNADFGFQHKHL